MRRLRYALWPAGLVLGVIAERLGRPELTALDAVAGFAFLGFGLLVWDRRPESWAGAITASTGLAWFVGAFGGWGLYLHRGPLAHLLLTYPTGRPSTRLDRVGVGMAYAYALAYPVAGNDAVTVAFALGLVTLCVRRVVIAGGMERRARTASLIAAAAFAFVLTLGASTRFAGAETGRSMLWAYDVGMVLIAAWLFAYGFWGRATQAAVTRLVVDLGDSAAAGTLRAKLARALDDPGLVLGYWLPEGQRYVDETGRAIELPVVGSDQAVTPIEEDGMQIAVLVHDRSVLDDPRLLPSVASAARLAVSNARLQVEVRARVAEVEASRRRVIEAGDAQRRRLEHELRERAERRLHRVAALLDECGTPLADARRGLDAARSDLRKFAQGIHPTALVAGGLPLALNELAARCSVPVEVCAPQQERLPLAVEAAVYFVCAEALTNIAKHGRASRAAIGVSAEKGWVTVEVTDDGIGGADLGRGSGLRGLADRVEALGGRLRVESAAARGTRVLAEIPLT